MRTHDAPQPAAPAFIAGLDLGQVTDYTALAVVERTEKPHPGGAGRTEYHYGVRGLHRWPLGTPYTDIVRDVSAKSAPIAWKVKAHRAFYEMGLSLGASDACHDVDRAARRERHDDADRPLRITLGVRGREAVH